jgi:anti-sigma B factor antagonist
VLSVHGGVDAQGSDALLREFSALLDAGAGEVTVDLGEAQLLDSAALGTLVHMWRQLRARHGRVRLANPRPDARRLLRITGLDRRFMIES